MDAVTSSGTTDFKLGDWWVRPQRNELEREGESVHIEARSMAVLVCLARHAPNVVSKQRLFEEVWSDSPYVGDDVISHAIWELRKALGDSARDPAYVKTVPRKGYRVVAEILRPQGSPLPMAGVQIDHYDIKDEIGRGAMGVVYEAVDRRLGRTVAIKFLAPELTRDPEACRRFEREARLAASLEHPNLGTVHEIGETSQGHRYLVGAYYGGGSLKDRLSEGAIEVSEAIRLMRQLLAGLGAAHERDIVHRDIKPANLLLDEHGTLKICDFGIAKLLGATDLTRTGAPIGTPAYKSPEQTEGRPVDHRTDLWSAGVVFFELLTGRRPFGGEEHAVVRSILSKEPQVLEDAHGHPVPEPLRRYVARALAKDPDERFQTSEEATRELSDLEEAALTSKIAGRRRWPTAAAIGLISLFLVFFVVWWRAQEAAELPSSAEEEVLAVVQKDMSPRAREEAQAYLAQGRKVWLRGNDGKNLIEAKRLFERAVDLQPDSADALAHLAAFLASRYSLNRQIEERDATRELIDKALTLDPSSGLARAAKARLLLKEGKYKQAEELAREAIRIEPKCLRDESCDLAYLCLADAYWEQDRQEDAMDVLTDCSSLGPPGAVQRNGESIIGGGYIRCRLRKALFHTKRSEKQEAAEEYEKVLKFEYQQTTALNEYSILLLTTGRNKEAALPLRRLYDQTRDPRVLNNLGMAQYAEGLWDQAIETYLQAHEDFEVAGTPMPTPLVALGDIYLELKEPDVARHWYARALKKFDALEDPGPIKKGERAVCLAKLGRFDEAEEAIERLLGEGEDDPDTTPVHTARIYALKDDRDRLFELARRWQRAGRDSARFLDDAAFIPYRKDREYQRILDPYLFSTNE